MEVKSYSDSFYKVQTSSIKTVDKNGNFKTTEGFNPFDKSIEEKPSEEKSVEESENIDKFFEEIISLLKRKFTSKELEELEKKLQELLKMKKENNVSVEDIDEAIKRLYKQIEEVKKELVKQMIKKGDDNSYLSNANNLQNKSNEINTFETNINNIQEKTKNSNENIFTINNINNSKTDDSLDELKLLLKMS